ncbi:MAG: alpha/beta fold hydrolase, partial [Hyphococcus sp.]
AKITKEQVRRYRDLIRREGNRTALLLALRQFALFDPVDKLSQIEAPALILWGVDDQALPVSDAQKFHDALPNSELAIFDNLGHVPMEEAPSQTLPVVQAFLERHLSREEPVDPLEQE